ncbi:MAG: immunity 50 family protein [Proteobacteria bacterium]|nr:immunity 50 family protein [Pseudomonadota bacterium]
MSASEANPVPLADIPGTPELIQWFGSFPRFHDATILGIDLRTGEPSRLRIRAFRMTDEVDDKGYFVLDRHALVTVTIEGVTEVNLVDFKLPGIIGDMVIASHDAGFRISWDSAYGVSGSIVADSIRFEIEALQPDESG